MTTTDGGSRRIQAASAALAPSRLSQAEVTVLAGLLHDTKVRRAKRAFGQLTALTAPTALPPLGGSAATP